MNYNFENSRGANIEGIRGRYNSPMSKRFGLGDNSQSP